MRERKPIPKNALEISQEQINPYLSNLGKPISEQHAFAHNRGTDYSAKNEKVKDISIGLEDIDNAIMYYFDNYIKPTVIQDNNRMAELMKYSKNNVDENNAAPEEPTDASTTA